MKINGIIPARTYSSASTFNNVQCPHGTSKAACPVCNGGGGSISGSYKKYDQYESTPETYSRWMAYLHSKEAKKLEKQMIETSHLLKIHEMKLLTMLIINKSSTLQVFQKVMNNVQAKLSAINNVINKTLNQLNKIIQNISQQILNDIKVLINQITSKLINQLKNITDFVNKFSTMIFKQFDKWKDNIKKGFKNIVKKIKEFFGGKNKKQKDQKKKKNSKEKENKEKSNE